MGDTITRMQADRDREDARYGALGVKMAEEQGAADKETETPAKLTGYAARAPLVPLRAVSLGESDAPLESDDPNDTTPRPEIRIVGTPSTARIAHTRAPSYPGVRKNSPKGPKETP